MEFRCRRVAVLPLALSILLAPLPVRAAESRHLLYKCVDAMAVTSIQSTPCPANATTVWKRDAPPDAAPTPEASALAEARRQRDRQAVKELSQQVERIQQAAASPPPPATDAADAATTVPVESPPPQAPNPDLQACQEAQDFANAARAKDWLGLSEEQVRRLYGWVAAQCKVPAAP